MLIVIKDDYEKCISGKECTFKFRPDNYFVSTSGK